MAYDLEKRLVIGLASSALFDLAESDAVFRKRGEAAYREYQREHQTDPLKPGVAFPFIRRLLSLNKLSPADPLVEVILLSRNDPDTGLRVMASIEHHRLGISRAVFLQGRTPHRYIAALNISLFLSANPNDVRDAIDAGHPAGQVLDSQFVDAEEDAELRIAFDFDGVLGDDGSETVYQQGGIDAFRRYEQEHATTAAKPGPLAPFLLKLAAIQAREAEACEVNPHYQRRLRVAIVTARDAPAHTRVITTMRQWGVGVNEAYFLGGVDKHKVLEVIRPHIFFDDQQGHLQAAASALPCVHVPFGALNRAA